MAADPNSTLARAKSKRLNSIIKYIEETQPSTLDLRDNKIDNDDLKSLLPYLPGSHITELILSRNNLKEMKDLAEVLPKTEIRRLDVSDCNLWTQDLLDIMEVLKDSKITELLVELIEFDGFEAEERDRLLLLMSSSHLTIFSLPYYWVDRENRSLFFQALLRTSITKIDMSDGPSDEILSALFSNLGQSSLKDISIEFNEAMLDLTVLTDLSRNLKNSKLEKLALSCNDLDDHQVDILADGLIGSNVVDLDLSCNKIRGATILGLRLKDTRIQKLSLQGNPLDQYGLFMSPDFLRSSLVTDLNVSRCDLDAEHFRRIMQGVKFSKVTNLDVNHNKLQDVSFFDFAEVVKDTNLEKVDFWGNKLSSDAFIALAECIKTSKLSHLNVMECLKYPNAKTLLPVFLDEVKGTSLDSLEFGRNELYESGAESLAYHLTKVTFTHLDLSSNKIRNGIVPLARHLRYSGLTRLCLSYNEISDEGVEALAKRLSETQLIELGLSNNSITDRGAEDLAACLKDSSLLRLRLSKNKIENDGINALARGAKNTFITVLDVSENPGNSFYLLNTTLWKNKTAAQCLINTFKLITPRSFGDCLHFDNYTNDQNYETFLENCLQLCTNILKKPSAYRVLKEAEAVSFSKEEITLLMSNDFPKQFSEFIASRVDADVTRHVNLLKSAEDKGLNKVVELLLLNRPLYMIDEAQGILHPHVYLLLNKYNYPLFNLAVEPEAKTKIIDYFTEYSVMEGAADVIRLVHGKRKL